MSRRFAVLLLSLAINGVLAADGSLQGSIENGRDLWTRNISIQGELRSCADCHTADPRQAGKHVRTGKPIKPLSPELNPASLSDPKKVEKWFQRNCKWTLGRACSAQEKADVLVFLKSS